MIITVNASDTVYSLSQRYNVPQQKIIADNGIVGDVLVVGQSLIIERASQSTTTEEITTAEDVAEDFGIAKKELFRNNYILGGENTIPKGTFLVIEYENIPDTKKITGGYAYDFISTTRLSSVINYLTYLMPFTYGFTPAGELIVPMDAYLLEAAENAGVKSLMHVSTLTGNGTFDSNLPTFIFSNPSAKEKLIDNIMSQVSKMGYDGVDVDFEFLPESEKQNYAEFIRLLADRLHMEEKILVVAVPPKTSDTQSGLLVEGIDYEALGENADFVLVMAYEYGYKFGPPLAIAPINQIRRVLDYAVTRIPNEKLLLGISNYGYDWTLPFVRGESDAPSISTVEAIELAKKYRAEISFDEDAKAPYFFYTDSEGRQHEVWFEDARSFEAKMDLIEEYNLAGGFIWDLMRENPQGFVTINSLIEIK